MLLWWAMLLDALPHDRGDRAAIELRSLAPAAELVPCIARGLAKDGVIVTQPIDGGTRIELLDEPSGEPRDTPRFAIAVTQAGPQRVIHATYRPPVTAKAADRLMARAARRCFREEWRAHEWERH